MSVGTAAGIPDEPKALERLLDGADAALYRSKHLGRNKVTRGDVLERGAKMATEKTPEPSLLKRRTIGRLIQAIAV